MQSIFNCSSHPAKATFLVSAIDREQLKKGPFGNNHTEKVDYEIIFDLTDLPPRTFMSKKKSLREGEILNS